MANGNAIRAGGAFVEVFTRDTALERGLKSARQKLRRFASGVQSLGLRAVGLGASILAPLTLAANRFKSMGDQIEKMTHRTGFAAESLSQLGFAAEQGGASIEQLDRALAAMARFALQAERGLATATDILDELGISVDQFNERKPEDKFFLLADAIDQVADPTKRAGIALQIFGRQGRELLPMLTGGSKAIRALMAEADRLGLTITTKQAKAAAELTDAWNRVRRQLLQVVFAIGSGLAPTLILLLGAAKAVLRPVIDWVKANPELAKTLAAVGVVVAGVGLGLLALSVAVKVVVFAFSGLLAVIGLLKVAFVALVSLPGLIVAGLASLLAWFVRTERASLELSEGFQRLKDDVSKSIGAIVKALRAGRLELALKIVTKSLSLIWKEFWRNMINDAINGLGKLPMKLLAMLPGEAGKQIKQGMKRLEGFELFEQGKAVKRLRREIDDLVRQANALGDKAPDKPDPKNLFRGADNAAAAGNRAVGSFSSTVINRLAFGGMSRLQKRIARNTKDTAEWSALIHAAVTALGATRYGF